MFHEKQKKKQCLSKHLLLGPHPWSYEDHKSCFVTLHFFVHLSVCTIHVFVRSLSCDMLVVAMVNQRMHLTTSPTQPTSIYQITSRVNTVVLPTTTTTKPDKYQNKHIDCVSRIQDSMSRDIYMRR